MDYELVWPADFDDYAWEVECKGWFPGLGIVIEGEVIQLTIYDPVRLGQDIEMELGLYGSSMFRRVIVVDTVTRENIEKAIAGLAKRGELVSLVE